MEHGDGLTGFPILLSFYALFENNTTNWTQLYFPMDIFYVFPFLSGRSNGFLHSAY
jgi:hypothetical protein